MSGGVRMWSWLAAAVIIPAAFWACVGDSSVGPSDAGDATTDTTTTPDSGPDVTSEGGCGDTQSSAANCGACGHACATGFACAAGHCGNEITQLMTSRGFPPTNYKSQILCVTLRSGQLYCWGDDSDGQLGVAPPNGNFAQKATHIAYDSTDAGFGGVLQVAAAESTTCTVNDGGSFCWGSNSSGQYGLGTTGGASSVPTHAIDAGVPLVGIGATLAAFCGLDATGNVYCWGYNAEDELGHDKATDPLSGPANATPTKVVFPFGSSDHITQVAGGPVHACALAASGHVYCWGHNQWGNIGNPTASDPQPTPLIVYGPNGETAGLGGVVELSAGSDFTCARTSQKTVYCWGYGGNGNCGNGASANVNSLPVQVKGPNGSGVLANVEGIGVGWFHSCAVVTGGNLYCWGTNAKGELGFGTSDGNVHNTPTAMVTGPTGGTSLLSNVVSVIGARETTCALKNDNTLWCWGENLIDSTHAGYLGNDDPNHADSPLPVQVVGLP